MENLNKLIDQLNLNKNITLEDIPNIDLYMDQVIQLFENKYASSLRNSDDKVLTKTMINNYAKGKLFVPIKNKKYSKEHLILISLIYQLKGALSINDIKATLDGVNKHILSEEVELDQFYESYLHLNEKNVEEFKENVPLHASNVIEEIKSLKEVDHEYFEKVLLITSFVHMSNLYRRLAEKLVDEIINED
ncbi:DUF1836 domain-containing protein [Cytobacillus sp. FJAT-54145]|uniref:DUF1836 domain-containing protein n=1 Tax=Cytobacillus spartinae TaxID=3299023 RepID=A0ABW6K8N9_9BACI